jgi:hypothetical protein
LTNEKEQEKDKVKQRRKGGGSHTDTRSKQTVARARKSRRAHDDEKRALARVAASLAMRNLSPTLSFHLKQ